jgi:sulfide dehydrogenase cytochrome subunit
VAAQWQQLMQDTHRLQAQFNDAVARYNVAIAQFPAVLLAWLFGFKQRAHISSSPQIRWRAAWLMDTTESSGPCGPTVGPCIPPRRSPMKTTWMMAALTLAAASAASAQTPDALYIKSLAATCANCHGTDGRRQWLQRAHHGRHAARVPGRPAQGIQVGRPPATVMHQLSKGYSDAQIEQIATYFAAQKK